ncbi:MAG: MFS transporter [Pseudomonadota bacterium]|nr:MFS transporter [Pseudomonadota bacterium]MEE3286826.1 MFS transporter [Pseudomonadota bacterium]
MGKSFRNHPWHTPVIVLIAGCLISACGFGARSVMGLYLEPMTGALNWNRETFAMAMAIQNLVWGMGMVVAGAAVDRHGPVWVIAGGAVVYALGLWGMTLSTTGAMLFLTGGVLTGLGVAFTGFPLTIAAMVRTVGPMRRSLVMGAGTAAGSVGQIFFSPFMQAMIEQFGWSDGLIILAFSTLIIIPLAMLLPNHTNVIEPDTEGQTLMVALAEAINHRGYILLTIGFFVCGFHVTFISVHFPAYVVDLGLSASVAAWCLSLIGFFNILGAIGAGIYGQKRSNSNGLCFLYAARSVVILGLLVMPKTEINIYIFASVMGLLWLSTVPLTTGVVTRIFGIRYMATLFGIVFLSHQLGSFLGVWLGGYIHDLTGSYDMVWQAGVVLGLFAALVHWPIDENPIRRANSTLRQPNPRPT